jgi:tRNA G18 (ribose-2'-O)-methylase SpoU
LLRESGNRGLLVQLSAVDTLRLVRVLDLPEAVELRGYFGIGIQNNKTPVNLGTLWRTAHSLGASYIFTISVRYQHQPSDTTKAWRHVPLFHYDTVDEFSDTLPDGARVIGVEIAPDARAISRFSHPERAVYVLGAEDWGLSQEMLKLCDDVVVLPGARCLNVAVAGSIVMYDRLAKLERAAISSQRSLKLA